MLDIIIYEHGPLGENTYLIIDNDSDEKAIIDPGYFGNDVIQQIGNADSLKYIFLTHAHFDHYYAAEKYMYSYENAKFVAPLKDKFLMDKSNNSEFSDAGIKHPACPEADYYVTEKDVFYLGKTPINFIETPGHTAGGLCILTDNKLFSGDTLFRLSVGNTSFETGNFSDLVNSIQSKLFKLNDDIVVYPGHGLKTTIAYEKRANPFV